MLSARPRRAALVGAAAASLALAFPLAGCGGDDDEPTAAKTKDDAPADATAPEGGQDAGSAGSDGSSVEGADTASGGGGTDGADETGGTGTADGGGTAYDPEQDTEENDIPPPAGSPGEQAEQVCEQNPGAC